VELPFASPEAPEGFELVPPGKLPLAPSPDESPEADPPGWLPLSLPVVSPLEVPEAPDRAESVPLSAPVPGVSEMAVGDPAVMVPERTELPSPPEKMPERPAWALAVAVAWALVTVFLPPKAPVSTANIKTTNMTKEKSRMACKVRFCLVPGEGVGVIS
jgi:hypothetical protein